MKIILIGIPGSGKSTQGNLLSRKLGIPYLSTGHIFRVLAREKTSIGRYIKEIVNAGYLVPDDKTLNIVKEYLKRPEYKKGYILDGFPRTLNQAKEFSEEIDKVLYLKISDKEALWRLSYRNGNDGREDDTLVAIRKRIQLFNKTTKPVIDFYNEKGVLSEINGENSIGMINKDVIEEIKKIIPKGVKINGNGHENHILAFVGMPGAGKSEAAVYLKEKGIPFVRFGEITDKGVKDMGASLNPENEKAFREKLRKELGMGAYAIKAEPEIEKMLKKNDLIVIDGLYSWEEYTYLKEKFPNLFLILIYSEPKIRYERLGKRVIRPFTSKESRLRDIAELEKLNKGGPISIADYMIENSGDNLEDFHKKIDILLTRLGIHV